MLSLGTGQQNYNFNTHQVPSLIRVPHWHEVSLTVSSTMFIRGDVQVGAGDWQTDKDSISATIINPRRARSVNSSAQRTHVTCIISSVVTVGKIRLPLQVPQIHRNTHFYSELRQDDCNHFKNA